LVERSKSDETAFQNVDRNRYSVPLSHFWGLSGVRARGIASAASCGG
jgi:hypothetical protein